MSFYVYILQSESSGKTYIGQTGDLERRVVEHNDHDRGNSHVANPDFSRTHTWASGSVSIGKTCD